MSAPNRLVTLLSTGLMLFTLVLSSSGRSLAQSERPGHVVLQGHRLAALSRARSLRPAEPERSLDLTVGLALRHQEDLDRIIAAQQDPASPWYHRWLTPEEFAERFAPTPDAYASVVEWLRQQNLQVTETWPNRLLINATGTVAQVDRALGTVISHYEHQGVTVYAPAQDPSVPAALASSIASIGGLDNVSVLRPRLKSTPYADAKPNLKIGSATLFGPKDLRTAYTITPLLNLGLTGSGQRIAIATAYTYKLSDVNSFESVAGLSKSPSSRFQNFYPTGNITQLGDETTLDVEWASSMAPGSSLQVVIAKNANLSSFTTVYNYIVTSLKTTHVVSTSWGLCESLMPSAVMATDHAIFSQGAAQGQTWFAASGDSGADDCGSTNTLPAVDFPASSPVVTAVGGTNLTVSFDSVGNATGYLGETAWSGSGGGKSVVFSKPSYQSTSTPADARRDVPDIALEAGPSPGNLLVFNGTIYRAWGTSIAAPQWAGITAILAQQKGGGVGSLNPRLYAMGIAGLGLHDVTTGNNTTSTTPGFSAGPGYDQATGWGSYSAYNFVLGY